MKVPHNPFDSLFVRSCGEAEKRAQKHTTKCMSDLCCSRVQEGADHAPILLLVQGSSASSISSVVVVDMGI
jgi:hypothetical protein